MYVAFWWEKLKERGLLEDLGVDGRIIKKINLEDIGQGAWTGLMWLKTGKTDRFFVNAVVYIRVLYDVGNFLTR